MGHVQDAFEGVEVEVPTGPVPVECGTETLHLRPLRVAEATRYLRLLASLEVTGGADGELAQILDDFPEAVGIEDVPLTPVEVIDVLRRFLSARRTPARGSMEDETTAASA